MKQNATLQTTCVLLILFLSYTSHVQIAPYLRNDLLGKSPDDRVNLEAVKELALKETTTNKEEGGKIGSFFSFVNTRSRIPTSVRNLRKASSLQTSAVAPTISGKSHSPPRAGGVELVEIRPQDSSSGGESKGSSGATAVDEAPFSQEQRTHPQSRPKHAKLTKGIPRREIFSRLSKDKARRLSRLLQMDAGHAAFNASTSTGIWTALGANEEISPGDSFMKNSDSKSSADSALSFESSKKFAMVRATETLIREPFKLTHHRFIQSL